MGASVESHAWPWMHDPGWRQPAEIEAYHDHRMAMGFAVAGLKIPGIRIVGAECVAKTFPDFFECFAALTR